MMCKSGIDRQRIGACLQQLQEQQRAVLLPEQGRLVASRLIEECCRLAIERLRHFHQKHPDDPGYGLAAFQGWLKRRWGEDVGTYVFEQLKQDQLKILGQYCCLTEFAPKMSAEDERLLGAIVGEFHAAAFQPPAVSALRCAGKASKQRIDKLVKIAVATGELVHIKPDLILHGQRLAELQQRIAGAVRETGGVTVADVRTLIDSSRKFVVPLLEYLDKTGFTKRVGDQRIIANDPEKGT
jgi:selenocysteine-specific elongation factor